MTVPRQYDGDFCAFCGHVFGRLDAWPRTCPNCHAATENMHIPLISVLVPNAGQFRVVETMPRTDQPGIYLPSTFLDFGETWRQAAARAIGLSSKDLSFRNLDSVSSKEKITHIFALVERGADLVTEGKIIQHFDQLTLSSARGVVEAWLQSNSNT